MASLQLNGSHICSSSMFQKGFLISTGECAWHIGNGIQKRMQRATAVVGHFDLKKGQRINILKVAYFSTYYRHEHEVGIIMVSG